MRGMDDMGRPDLRRENQNLQAENQDLRRKVEQCSAVQCSVGMGKNLLARIFWPILALLLQNISPAHP
jgi:hypothetical protein